MKNMTKPPVQACAPMPDFERLNFYYGQALGVADFQTEQGYFLEKLRLYNRCFHGYGIVCGLEVSPIPTDTDCDSEGQGQRRQLQQTIAAIDAEITALQAELEKGGDEKAIKEQLQALQAQRETVQRRLDDLPDCLPKDQPIPAEVSINCGWALDCEGREIIVRQPQTLDLWSLLSAEQHRQIQQRQQAGETEIVVELSLCYCEQPTYPSRPVVTDTCAAIAKCVYGRTREGFKFHLNLTVSEPDTRCGNCCEACENECVVLAHIHWNPSRVIVLDDIDWRPRRSASVYQPTVITGISWLHGATYTAEQSKDILGTEQTVNPRTDGIEVTFSKPVYAETLQPGVVEFVRYQGGSGVSGLMSHIEGSFVNKPDTGLINGFKYRDNSGETLNRGDRVLISIRGNFILDSCCQPIDGEHIGGQVPQLAQYQRDDIDLSKLPPVPPCAAARQQPWDFR